MVEQAEESVLDANAMILKLKVDAHLSSQKAAELLSQAAETMHLLQELYLENLDPQYTPLIASLIQKNLNLKLINLGGCQLGEAGLVIIHQALMANQGLEALFLHENALDSRCIPILKQLLYGRALQNLVLGGNQLHEDDVWELLPVLKQQPLHQSLRSLSLSGNPLGDGGVGILGAWLISSTNSPHLEELYLKNVGMGSAGLKAVANVIEHSSQLKIIAIENNLLTHSSEAIKLLVRALKRNAVLTQVGIDADVFDAPAFHAVLVQSPVSVALRRLNRQAKSYYLARAEALTDDVLRMHYFQCCLQLDPEALEAQQGLEKAQLRQLDAAYRIAATGRDRQALDQQLMQKFQQLESKWQAYMQQAQDQDEYDFKGVGQHLRALIKQLQTSIASNFAYSENKTLFPLFQALEKGDTSQLKRLISERGWDPNLGDKAGMTALHYAAKLGDQVLVEYLVALGAKAHYKTQTREYPWQLVNPKRKALVNYLKELQYIHARTAETKVLRLLRELAQAELAEPVKHRLEKKLEEIVHEKAVLEQVYARACLAHPEHQQELKLLYTTYQGVYDPLLKGANKPACYLEDIANLKALENQLVKKTLGLATEVLGAAVHLLGFYNQIAKCVMDLCILKELTAEELQAGYQFYQTQEQARMQADRKMAEQLPVVSKPMQPPSQPVSAASHPSTFFKGTQAQQEKRYYRCVEGIYLQLQRTSLQQGLTEHVETLQAWKTKVDKEWEALQQQASISPAQLSNLETYETFSQWLAEQSEALLHQRLYR